MNKRKTYIALFFILILAFFAANLSYPGYFNQGVDYINNFQFSIFNFQFKLPHFWNIPFKLGLDLQGGTHLVYEADLSNIQKKDYGSAMETLKDRIERRIDSRRMAGVFGVQESLVQIQQTGEHHRLIIELPGIKNPAEAIKFIGEAPFLEFKEQKTEQEIQKIIDKQKEVEGKTLEEAEEIEDWQVAFEDIFRSTQLTGKYLKIEGTEMGFDQTTQAPLILLQFNNEGAKIFEELTSRNIGKPLAIYIDGELLSAPVVQDKISGGKAQITGDFTINEARKIVNNLRDGALPLPIKIVSQQSVGPVLGEISLEESLKAGITGLFIVIIFLIVFYRFPGFLASVTLGIYIALILSLFKLIPVTLTLAGIGGFILSIGMAVDANILIFSRFREELKEGKSFNVSLEEGFRRSWSSIRDGNLTTLLVALILFWFGTSFIKGFAFTLSIGILVSIFSAIFITKIFMKVFAGTKMENWKKLWA